MPRAVADVLGVPEATCKSVPETLATSLRSRQSLILLDNCEHLAQASAQLCHTLLQACPKLQILATSREPLHISGEIVWLVPSLSLPDPQHLPAIEELINYASVRLFVERAQAVQASFALTAANASVVTRLCFHLDGIPLALELAAARVSVLSVEQVLARLDDRFRLLTTGSRTALNRQQTLQAAIDWSYDLLSDGERVLFRRLAVFAGGWTLEAAEQVAGDHQTALSPATVLDQLSRLIDKSLVLVEQRHGEARFRMLETIHEYARQRLDAAGEAQPVAARHCAWCLSLVAQVNRNLWGPDHIRWVDRLESEHDNVRAALGWGAAHDRPVGLRLAVVLEQFWVLRGYAREGLAWLDSLLPPAPGLPTLRAEGLLSQLLLRAQIGDYRGDADNEVEGILSLYGQSEDKAERVRSYQIAGGITYLRTNRAAAKPFFESSLTLAGEIGYAANLACAEQFLAVQLCGAGDFERAQTLLDRSVQRLRELGDEPDVSPLFLNINQMPFAYSVRRQWRIVDEENFLLIRHFSAASAVGYALANLGSAARATRNHTRAAAFFDASRAHFVEIGNQSGLSQVLGQQGYLFVTAGDGGRAQTVLESSLALRRELGDRRGYGRSLNNLANAATYGGDYAHARAWLDESLERFQEMGDRPGLAQTYNHLGNWALEQGNFALAESYYQQSLNLFQEFGNRGARPFCSISPHARVAPATLT